ncbi:MAG: YwaF family protein [Oscillospiraceae bacterium]|nr:YwaF family protein [Oscillospiraceae bacterium]
MLFSEWLFGGIENPVINGRWGSLHIATLVICVISIVGAHFIVKRSVDKEKTKNCILYTLAGLIAFFEIMIRFVYFMKLYYFHQPEMAGTGVLWILIPKPWCAIACWLLIACVFVKKTYFYNFASLSALLCAVVFFAYPGVGYNNQIILFENLYSIVTHALLLTMSITMMVLKVTDFRYKYMGKLAVCFAATYVYGLVEIFVLKTQEDPMYFMPNGDIQADILKISYGLYLAAYIAIIVVYVNVFHVISDKETVKAFFSRRGRKPAGAAAPGSIKE